MVNRLLHIILLIIIFVFSSQAWAVTLKVGSGKGYDPANFGANVSRAIEGAAKDASDGDIVEIQDGINGANLDLIHIKKNMGGAT